MPTAKPPLPPTDPPAAEPPRGRPDAGGEPAVVDLIELADSATEARLARADPAAGYSDIAIGTWPDAAVAATAQADALGVAAEAIGAAGWGEQDAEMRLRAEAEEGRRYLDREAILALPDELAATGFDAAAELLDDAARGHDLRLPSWCRWAQETLSWADQFATIQDALVGVAGALPPLGWDDAVADIGAVLAQQLDLRRTVGAVAEDHLIGPWPSPGLDRAAQALAWGDAAQELGTEAGRAIAAFDGQALALESVGVGPLAAMADLVAPVGWAEEIDRFAALAASAIALPAVAQPIAIDANRLLGGTVTAAEALCYGLIGGTTVASADLDLVGLIDEAVSDFWIGQAASGLVESLADGLGAPAVEALAREAGLLWGTDPAVADPTTALVSWVGEVADPIALFGAIAEPAPVAGRILADEVWSYDALEAAARAAAGIDWVARWPDALLRHAAEAVARSVDLVTPADVEVDPFERDLLLVEEPTADPATRLAALDRLAAPFDRLVGRRRLWPALASRAGRLRELGLAASPRSVLREEVRAAIVLVLGSAGTPQCVRVGNGWLKSAAGRKAVVAPDDLPWDLFDGWFRAEVARRVEASLRDRPDRLLVPRPPGGNALDREAPLADATSALLADPGAVDPLHALLAREAGEEQRALLDACAAAATPRQREILHLLRRGWDYGGVARLLGISPRTVRAQLTFLRKRLRAA